jgi:hypothetical protein
MRTLLLALATLVVLGTPSAALAQSPPVTTADPAQYMRDVSALMSRTGISTLRDIYVTMFQTSALPASVEGALVTYERLVAGRQAVLGRIVEDTQLSDTFRSIYTYHYFGDNAWLFTRFDFVRISDTEWALSAAVFSSEWSNVAALATPGFTSNVR